MSVFILIGKYQYPLQFNLALNTKLWFWLNSALEMHMFPNVYFIVNQKPPNTHTAYQEVM